MKTEREGGLSVSIGSGSEATSTNTSSPKPTLTRRGVLKRAVGLAALGAAGGVVMAETKASPAMAAGGTTEPGAIAPAVVVLTDAPNIAVDASLGNDFRVTIAASRAIENPVNALDGQKIVLQITQGAAGSSTITWGSAYEFATGLPQPVLSTAAGETDLLAFIYNAARSKWLMAAFVNGFNPVPVQTQPPGTFRLFSSTNGPASPASYTGPFLAGVLFEVTTEGCWLEGYWWWVCASGQSAAAQKFALWQVYGPGAGAIVASATVASGSLLPGQWNYVPLATPVLLSSGATYVACTGFNNSFPIATDEFGAGQAYAAGIVNGPLSAFSDLTGSLPAPFNINQGLFGVAGSDPTVNMPVEGWESSNFWVDLQVTTAAPAGATYRLWPSYPKPAGSAASDTTGYTLATEFQLSEPCALDRIWFYSPPGAAALPSHCGIWNVATNSEVSGTDNGSPAWSGAAGSGWVVCAYSGVVLPAGDYKAAVFYGGGVTWFQSTPGYWSTSGAGAGGIACGPIIAPSSSSATPPGQGTYNQGSWAYPLTYASTGNGENFWVDVEVTPS